MRVADDWLGEFFDCAQARSLEWTTSFPLLHTAPAIQNYAAVAQKKLMPATRIVGKTALGGPSLSRPFNGSAPLLLGLLGWVVMTNRTPNASRGFKRWGFSPSPKALAATA